MAHLIIPFIDDFPIQTSIYKGFSMAMLVITRWYICCLGFWDEDHNRLVLTETLGTAQDPGTAESQVRSTAG